MFPSEFRGEINHEETRVTGLLRGGSCMILTSTVFDWSTRAMDGRIETDARQHVARYAYNAVALKTFNQNKRNMKCVKNKL